MCKGCEGVFGFKLYPTGPRIEAALREEVLQRQQLRQKQRAEQAQRTAKAAASAPAAAEKADASSADDDAVSCPAHPARPAAPERRRMSLFATRHAAPPPSRWLLLWRRSSRHLRCPTPPH